MTILTIGGKVISSKFRLIIRKVTKYGYHFETVFHVERHNAFKSNNVNCYAVHSEVLKDSFWWVKP